MQRASRPTVRALDKANRRAENETVEAQELVLPFWDGIFPHSARLSLISSRFCCRGWLSCFMSTAQLFARQRRVAQTMRVSPEYGRQSTAFVEVPGATSLPSCLSGKGYTGLLETSTGRQRVTCREGDKSTWSGTVTVPGSS